MTITAVNLIIMHFIEASPTFLVTPQNSEVSLNGKIELDCEANGIPSPQVYWKINDTKFNGINTRLYKYFKKSLLISL